MSERVDQRPTLVKVKGLRRSKQCLKNPQYECACFLSDEKTRKKTLKELRHELGAYSFINLLDEGLAKRYGQRKEQLCEGRIPTFTERLQQFFSKRSS